MKWAILLLAACSGHAPPVTGGAGSGSGSSVPGPAPSTCEVVRPKVEQLYRAEATAKEPKRVDAATADNTRMVMLECAKEPAKVAACIQGASSVAELERACLSPLDDEGTEGTNLP